MRDKRKVLFFIICLIVTIIFDFVLYKNAYNENIQFKEVMKNKLNPIARELESRGFVNKEKNNSIESGILEFERSGRSDYGLVEIKYDLKGLIKDASIDLEYPADSYSEDIFSEASFILDLVGIDIDEQKYMNALNTLTDTSKSDKIDSNIASNIIEINNKNYEFSLKKVSDKYGNSNIRFCLE